MKQVSVVGIAGGTASGKSTIVSYIKEFFKDDIELICHDSYYKANDDKTMEERQNLNYDHPSSFETKRMIEDIKKLKAGQEVEVPVYDYTNHTRSGETVLAHPKKVIIVEGILIFEDPELRDLMDIKVFVDTDADVRIIRRLLRDVQERGRDLDSVVNQYLGTVKPMHEEFVDPSKKRADIIIPEGGANDVALNMLLEKIKSFLVQN